MKMLALILALFALTGCGGKAESSTPAGVDFKVDRLFTHDGCTVYRFEDFGNYRYFTNCSGETSWRESCGKNCSREVSVIGGRE